ncbi:MULTISPECIES: hypothetical protein [Desulfitobacterium]|uniref:Uncharacterized protein n=1 Tax=Desulfitobacterium dehalogenans (strain ATCC 51507 / DSM 9161 / JW/IU-DC1) TaxID=756499 RepID=I4A9T8_DESDJ|nr:MULTISPECIES: hypothetical protein [Desulfitobacterium]AFM00723.1 hypothetical protein Desde_2385 [Desulfitobacterium dehalogenans ATCC 51507]
MFRKSKVPNRGTQPEQYLAYQKKIKTMRSPAEAIEFLQEVTEGLANADRHALEAFILYLRQWADDIQFKYYKARCLYMTIPPEDSLAFWLCYTLGRLPETIRFSSFEGEVLELLKILSLAEQSPTTWKQDTWGKKDALCKEMDCALSFLKEDYPVFFNSLTKNPLLVPVLSFRLKLREGSLMTIPRLHCLGVFQPNMERELLLPILHALVHILHYSITEDTKVMPPGFMNMVKQIFDDYQMNPEDGGEFFAELFVASLLYDTEYMPLVAYMELCHEDQIIIKNYFTWLETIYASSIQDNMLRVIHQWDELRRA